MAVTSDGRQIQMPSLFPAGVYLNFAGAADDPVAGRGKGAAFSAALTTATVKTITFGFNDYVYLSGGWASWDNAVFGDTIGFSVQAPATTYTNNTLGTGNATLGAGGVITPAAGNGNINLVNAVPVPHTTAGNGAWAWVPSSYNPANPWTPDMNANPSPPTGSGQLIATPSGYDPNLNWTYDLYAGAVPLASFVGSMSITGTRQRDFTLPAIKPQLVLPQWTITATINSAVGVVSRPGGNALTVSFCLTVARNSTV